MHHCRDSPSFPGCRHIGTQAAADQLRRAILAIINPSTSSAHDVSPSLAERAWREVHAASSMAQPPINFEVVYESSLAAGAHIISRAINLLR